ncbi:MAG TPA: CoA transferase, partial [Caulobacteraceae bacterium]|nr:CoA transferase [Caulobacteraceae bacterium]
MTALAHALAAFAAEIAERSARLGRRVEVDVAAVADRSDAVALGRPGLWSPNRSCRMVRAADGWIAVNLPREADLESVPAWLGQDVGDDPWATIVRVARREAAADLVAQARLLGLPVCRVGEIRAESPASPLVPMSGAAGRAPIRGGRVVDLTALWAGPLSGAVLAEAGFEVVKVDSRRRPDVMEQASPAFFARLNAAKSRLALDLSAAGDRARLAELLAGAAMVITSARPRAFEQMGLSPEAVFAGNPSLIWIAVTGYGWSGDGADRVAFGDDAAAAGGLVRWTRAGAPRFAGDALA